MAKIIIEVENIDDAADACREVATSIENGYYCGTIGVSSDTWEIED